MGDSLVFTRTCLTVASSSYATGLFLVPIDAARSVVPDDYFRVAEVFPDKAVFFIGTGEFRKSELGPYREMYVGFYTENREGGEAATLESNRAEFDRNESKMYMWKNWLNKDAAVERMDAAGSRVFRRGEVELDASADAAVFSMRHASEGGIRFTTPTRSDLVQSDFPMKRTHYGRLHDVPSRCQLDLRIETMATSPGQGELVLEGEIARECEPLELSEQPIVSIWIEEMSFTMNKPLVLPGHASEPTNA